MKIKDGNGYVAILTAIIVSVIFAVIVFVMSLSSFLGRENALGFHLKEKSRALAEACVETARLKVLQNPGYAGGENVAVASDTCRVVSVVNAGGNDVISAQGNYLNFYTDLKVTVHPSDASIVSWLELAHF